MKSKWTHIGEVAVDSGQLLVCDPCYLLSQWKGKGKQTPKRAPAYKHKDGSILYCGMHGSEPCPGAICFSHYLEVIPKYGKTANQLGADGDMKPMPRLDPSGEFSYSGCSEATLSTEQVGQLNFQAGHSGAGVAFSSGMGDGVYDVYAKFADCGSYGRRVTDIKIRLISDRAVREMQEEAEYEAHTD